jgi:hypothetical protein
MLPLESKPFAAANCEERPIGTKNSFEANRQINILKEHRSEDHKQKTNYAKNSKRKNVIIGCLVLFLISVVYLPTEMKNDEIQTVFLGYEFIWDIYF